jgi:hypothetical protein
MIFQDMLQPSRQAKRDSKLFASKKEEVLEALVLTLDVSPQRLFLTLLTSSMRLSTVSKIWV